MGGCAVSLFDWYMRLPVRLVPSVLVLRFCHLSVHSWREDEWVRFPHPCIRLGWFLSCWPLLSALVRHCVCLILRAHHAPSFCSERFGIAPA